MSALPFTLTPTPREQLALAVDPIARCLRRRFPKVDVDVMLCDYGHVLAVSWRMRLYDGRRGVRTRPSMIARANEAALVRQASVAILDSAYRAAPPAPARRRFRLFGWLR